MNNNDLDNPKKEEKDLLLDHDFDGIKELDNAIPGWFLYMFYITIFIAVIYVFHYHLFKQGPLQDEEYAREMASLTADSSDTHMLDLVLLTDAASLEKGKALYQEKLCYSCHGNLGEGNAIGPNLTDEYWIHGSTYKEIVTIITAGVPQKGMAPFGDQLPAEAIHQIASYVVSIQGSNPANAKAPQGDKVQ